ncbi:MAG: cobalamin biosynthesis protein, partial [Proteobacteria bacterium]|nr:cobalamin biosynthesis protein [Pseudomonadota bacterium]
MTPNFSLMLDPPWRAVLKRRRDLIDYGREPAVRQERGRAAVDPRASHTHAPAMLITWLSGLGPPADPFALLLLALAVDAAFGDPKWLYRVLPHPVAMIGKLIEAGERRLNRPDLGRVAGVLRGLLLVVLVVAVSAGLGWALE